MTLNSIVLVTAEKVAQPLTLYRSLSLHASSASLGTVTHTLEPRFDLELRQRLIVLPIVVSERLRWVPIARWVCGRRRRVSGRRIIGRHRVHRWTVTVVIDVALSLDKSPPAHRPDISHKDTEISNEIAIHFSLQQLFSNLSSNDRYQIYLRT